MRPRLRSGALLLIDRHYPSLQRYWQREQNLYAVLSDGEWKVRHAETAVNLRCVRKFPVGAPHRWAGAKRRRRIAVAESGAHLQ